jgi:DNA-binding PadR family transcriptional regulator
VRGLQPSPTERQILDLLGDETEKYGLQLVRSGIRRGTVYVLLGRLECKGLVASRQPDPQSNMKLYAITELGRKVRRALQAADRILNSKDSSP